MRIVHSAFALAMACTGHASFGSDVAVTVLCANVANSGTNDTITIGVKKGSRVVGSKTVSVAENKCKLLGLPMPLIVSIPVDTNSDSRADDPCKLSGSDIDGLAITTSGQDAALIRSVLVKYGDNGQHSASFSRSDAKGWCLSTDANDSLGSSAQHGSCTQCLGLAFSSRGVTQGNCNAIPSFATLTSSRRKSWSGSVSYGVASASGSGQVNYPCNDRLEMTHTATLKASASLTVSVRCRLDLQGNTTACVNLATRRWDTSTATCDVTNSVGSLPSIFGSAPKLCADIDLTGATSSNPTGSYKIRIESAIGGKTLVDERF